MTTVAVGVSIVVLTLFAWFVGEAHYRGCVESAVAVTQNVRAAPSLIDQPGVSASSRARISAVNGCSRLPF